MCGIFGTVQPGVRAADLFSLGERANQQQAHRGPDQEGLVANDGWLLAHRRLAIFDTSESGRQPLAYGSDLTIIFNGAVYNFPQLRRELRQLGYTFASDTDTEVVLAAYLAWGVACFQRFNGMWALAIIDTKQRKLLLSRDRIGIKPLYLCEEKGRLSFASETRALRKIVGRGDDFNTDVVRDYLLHGWQDHRPETMWGGIRQYPPGHYSVYHLDSLELLQQKTYYHFPPPGREVEPGDLLENFRALLTDSVRLRIRSDVGCGLTLSGGIDSSAIAGSLGPEHATYSVRFPGTKYDESTYIDAVLRHRGLKNHSITPSWEDFVWDYEACMRGQDQPLASAAVVAHYTLMGLLRRAGERVVLNGQGADEIGGGYDKFYLPHLREQLSAGPLAGLRAGWGMMRNMRIGPDQLSSRLQGWWSPAAPATFLAPALRAQNSFRRPAGKDVYQTSVNLLTGVGFPVLLRHEDRSSMAHGIESRTPFLDYRVVDFLLAAPSHFKINYGIRKWGIRESVKPLLPPEVYGRKRKLGFATPQARWMEAHPAFFVRAITDYVRKGDALLLPAAAQFAEEVLRKRRWVYYPLVWRWWSWAVFVDGLKSS